MTDSDPLSDLLQRWQPKPGPAPDFAARVRTRIARHEAAPMGSPWARLLAWPASLPLAAALAIIIGVASAVTVQQANTRQIMADAYARSIDPVRLTADGATAPHHDHLHP